MPAWLRSAPLPAGAHGIRADWTVDCLACGYHVGKFAVFAAVEGIIITIAVLGLSKECVMLMFNVSHDILFRSDPGCSGNKA